MPTVAIVEGVMIRFYPDEHQPPHFHAVFAEFTAQIRIDAVRITRGSLPPNKVHVVLDRAAEHKEQLLVFRSRRMDPAEPNQLVMAAEAATHDTDPNTCG